MFHSYCKDINYPAWKNFCKELFYTALHPCYAGKLVPVGHTLSGLGGAATAVKISCSGCGLSIDFASSAMCGDMKRHTVVSLSLRLAAFISGIGFAGCYKLFKRHLGMHSITSRNFFKMVYPHAKDMLDELCETKDVKKFLPNEQLGSWKRAVTTSDGVWAIRG